MSFVSTHQPCPCGQSSDAYGVNDEGWGHCFSCQKRFPPEGDAPTSRKPKLVKDLVTGIEFVDLVSRKIKAETCRRYGYGRAVYNDRTVQVAPYRRDGQIVGQKLRDAEKNFWVVGEMKNVELFGQHLFTSGSKQFRSTGPGRLIITEGEIDCLSVAEALRNRWPVVSIPNGASSAQKAIKENIEFVESFDEVVLCFDSDDPGLNAAQHVAMIITPGKAKITQLPRKDANEMWVEGDARGLVDAIYNAKGVRPDGLVRGSEMWSALSIPLEMGTPYPWHGLNEYLFGLRPREIVTFTAGSGIGKSAAVAEIAYDLAFNQNQKVGYVALEENVERSGRRFLGIHMNKPLHLPKFQPSQEELRKSFEATLARDNMFFYDHFGSLDSDNLLNKLRYMVLGMDCRWLFLDHLSIMVSGLDPDDDERRAIDRTMTRLRSFTEETNVGLVLVSHLKRPDKRGHEEGAATSLAQLRGSAAIAQLSDSVIGLERNQQGDEDERNVTRVRVLKNRYAGLTGPVTTLVYDHDTGRLREEDAPASDFNDEQEGGDF